MRLKTYWTVLYNSVTNPKYYIDVLNVRLWYSVRFLVMSYLFLTILGGIIFFSIDVPKLDQSFRPFLNKTVQEFPDNQRFSWDGNKVTSAQPEPFAVTFPKLPNAVGTPEQLLVVDPKVQNVNEITQSVERQSMFFVGQNALYMSQPGGGWSELPLSELLSSDSFNIDKKSLNDGLPTYQSQLQSTLRALPFLFMVFFFFISFPLRLIGILIDSIFLYFLIRLSGLPLSYKKIAQVSLHVMVAAELITILTANFALDLPMFSIAFWGYTFLIYWQLRHIKAFKLNEMAGHQGK